MHARTPLPTPHARARAHTRTHAHTRAHTHGCLPAQPPRYHPRRLRRAHFDRSRRIPEPGVLQRAKWPCAARVVVVWLLRLLFHRAAALHTTDLRREGPTCAQSRVDRVLGRRVACPVGRRRLRRRRPRPARPRPTVRLRANGQCCDGDVGIRPRGRRAALHSDARRDHVHRRLSADRHLAPHRGRDCPAIPADRHHRAALRHGQGLVGHFSERRRRHLIRHERPRARLRTEAVAVVHVVEDAHGRP